MAEGSFETACLTLECPFHLKSPLDFGTAFADFRLSVLSLPMKMSFQGVDLRQLEGSSTAFCGSAFRA